VIYLDSSVLLSQLLMEERRPPDWFWRQPMASSRLLAYEVWARVHARGVPEEQHSEVRGALARIELVAMSEASLARALQPFPVALRTLDALHLATAVFLNAESDPVQLASYDNRLITAAQALGIAVVPL
jgi:predicted nucleic acid-binding protein